jgi:hypothetical protein
MQTRERSRNAGTMIPTGEAFIFRLPDEILLTIVEDATSRADTYGSLWRYGCANQVDYKAAESVALACHRLNRLATPTFYLIIDFGYPVNIVRPTRAVKSLHRILHQNPRSRNTVEQLKFISATL